MILRSSEAAAVTVVQAAQSICTNYDGIHPIFLFRFFFSKARSTPIHKDARMSDQEILLQRGCVIPGILLGEKLCFRLQMPANSGPRTWENQ